MDESNFASLGPMLLARKGGAKPAMRPQLGPLNGGSPDGGKSDADALEDLGWNDMGEADERPANVVNLTPEPANPATDAEAAEQALIARTELSEAALDPPVVPSDVHRQQRDIAARMETDRPSEPAPTASFGSPIMAKPAKVQALPPVIDDESEEEEEAFLPETAVLEAAPSQEPHWLHYRVEPEGKAEQSELERPATVQASEPAPEPVVRRAARDQGKRAAFTLRLDQDRHLKLRLAATMRNLSAQQLVTQALDRMLEDMPELESLAAQMARH
ncbi:MAG: hypothetical protein WA954_08225 [Parerythrobacter sp.]